MSNKLPVGISTFSDLIEGGYTYVDKTKIIYELVKNSKGYYFLSRPRRFGKSLLISTFESIFKGREDLFKDLWIKEESDYEWQEHPVIKLDLSNLNSKVPERLVSNLSDKLINIANDYNLEIKPNDLGLLFEELISKLYSKFDKSVVVLIDEYDSPIVSNISNPELAKKNRKALSDFFKTLKVQDEYIRFIFLTGVSRFSKTSVFSELNNLTDLTMSKGSASLLGYTEGELNKYFSDNILDLSRYKNIEQAKLLSDIKKWYNGYRFSIEDIKVYNPFSILNLFTEKEFKNYWINSGTPSFLFNLLKNTDYNLAGITREVITEDELSIYDIEDLPILPLLFQTGYLTISNIDASSSLSTAYQLSYPNREVRVSFLHHFIRNGLQRKNSQSYLLKLSKAIESNNLDLFFNILTKFFSEITYEIQPKGKYQLDKFPEYYYQSILYSLLKLLGMELRAESKTNIGSIDLVLETASNIYLIEMKIDKSKEEAIEQIKDRKYYQKFLDEDKKVTLVGINFSSKDRNIEDWGSESVVFKAPV